MGSTLLMPSMAATLLSLLVVLLFLGDRGPCASLLWMMRLALVYGLDLAKAEECDCSAAAIVPHIYVREANECVALILVRLGRRRCSEGTFSLCMLIKVTLKGRPFLWLRFGRRATRSHRRALRRPRV